MNATSCRRPAGAALAGVLAALLTGCGVDDLLSSDDPEPGPPLETSAGAGPEDGLAPGDTYDGAVSTTVVEIAQGGEPGWGPAPEGSDWLWADVRSCLADGATAEVGWYQWAASGPDEAWYPAALDYDGARPTDQYPRLTDLASGECVAGRILFAVPDDAEVVTLVHADESGTPQARWLVGDAGAPVDSGGE